MLLDLANHTKVALELGCDHLANPREHLIRGENEKNKIKPSQVESVVLLGQAESEARKNMQRKGANLRAQRHGNLTRRKIVTVLEWRPK